MNFKNKIIELLKENNIDLFVDMDGVIALYDIGKPYNFDKKRPLLSNIKLLEEISHLDGITMHILSICKNDEQINEKNNWLDIHAPFFDKDKRFILSKETIVDTSSPNMKLNFLSEFKTNNIKALIDDDNQVLKTIKNNAKEVVLFQDSELID